MVTAEDFCFDEDGRGIHVRGGLFSPRWKTGCAEVGEDGTKGEFAPGVPCSWVLQGAVF
jgi:hypothetical protein